MKWSFLFVLAAASALSCSQSAPRIDSAFLRLTYRQGGVEGLSFFVLAADEDGSLDLEELHLLNDRAQLYWTLTAKDWITEERVGETWIGTHSLTMPDGEKFPRGPYRIVLADKGGDRAERTISLDPPLSPARAFPSFSAAGGRYRVSSSYPANSIVAYDEAGAAVRTVVLQAREGRIADLDLGPTARSIALWAVDEESGVAALTDPMSLKGLY
jgi:hypothetical protein